MYAESGISVSLVSSFVIVLILSESFAGSGFGILVGGLYHLKFPCNRVQWQEQPPERRATKRGDAAAVEKEGRETQGAATSSLTKSRFYKQYIFFKLLTKLGGLHLQDGRMLDYFSPPFFSIGYGLPRGGWPLDRGLPEINIRRGRNAILFDVVLVVYL